MASPQLEDGYIRYSHELDAAIAVGGFREMQRIVLRIVTGQIFRPDGPKAARIDVNALAKEFGFDDANLYRAIRTLVESNVLSPTEDRPKQYRFVKDYETWTLNGRTRISPDLVAFCKASKRLAMGAIRAVR